MDKLRDFLQSWPGRILMLLCLSPMVFLGMEGYFTGGQLNADQVAKVGDTPISVEQLRSEMTYTKNQLMANTDPSLIDDIALKKQTLDNLINRTLLETQASLLGMHLSDEAITKLLQNDPTFADANGQFSNDLFAQYLQQNGLTKDRLFDTYRNQLNLRSLMNSVLSTAIYPNSQISRLIDLQTQSRPVWVKRIAWQDFAKQVSITDTDIQNYYNSHKDQLVNAERVDLHVLAIDNNNVKTPAPSDDELLAMYQESQLQNKSLAHILITDNNVDKIANAQNALQAGEDFAQVAKTYSDDPTKEMGGEIGTFSESLFGANAQVVKDAIMPLNKGQISQPIKTSFGTHIFKVIDVAAAPSFEQQKTALKAQFINQSVQQNRQELIVNINTKIANGFSLKDVADEYQLVLQTITDYPKTNNTTALNQPAIIHAAFDEFTLSDGGVSPNLEVAGKTIWVQPTNHRLADNMTLEQARPLITQKLTQQKATDLAMQQAKKQAANDNHDITNFQALGDVSHQHPAIGDDERTQLFIHKASDDKLASWAVLTDKGASVFLGGKITTNRTSVMSDIEKSIAATMIKDNAGQDYLEDYLRYLRDNHKVQINDSVLQSL